MSASQGRLRSAIQRIAREDPEIRGTIDAFKDRGGFDSASTQVAGADDDRGICCDGSSSSNRNPGSDTRDPSESAKDGLDPDDPADISDNLTGVVDCATGQPIQFMGGDCIPPQRDPPLSTKGQWIDCKNYESGWEKGYYWRSFIFLTQYLGFDAAETIRKFEDREPTFTASGGSYNDSGDIFTYTITQDPNAGGFVAEAQATRLSCSVNYREEYCTATEPPPTPQWPEDGAVSLYIVNGSIVGSKYDPENDGSYSAPRDEIELCDIESGARILIRPSSDGGWKSIESLDGDIDPGTGNGYLYAPDGKRIRQISPSEFRDDIV